MNIGDRWNGWTVESLIGSGSFGNVYKIVREEFGFSYESALKVIRVPQNPSDVTPLRYSGMDEDAVTEYFKSIVKNIISEFTIMSRMRGHSNIVSYEDHSVRELQDEFGWEICIRMELLTPLYSYIRNNNMTVGDVIRLGIDLCRALEMCEQRNIVHRDIKPGNIFVSEQGTFKLGDFGVARQMEKTTSGMSKKGTYSYMAPEVHREEAYDSTVDIYSLGIVLYRFMNNNRAPFMPPYPQKITYDDTEQSNRRRMRGDALPSPCNANKEFADVILKACAYLPEDRYKSAREMREALESLSSIESSSGASAGEYLLPQASDVSILSTLQQAKEDPADEETIAMEVPHDPANSSVEIEPAASADKKGNRSTVIAVLVIAAIVLACTIGYFVHAGNHENDDLPFPVEDAETGEAAPEPDNEGNIRYTHHGISISIPENMEEEGGSIFAYPDDDRVNYEFWYRYWESDVEYDPEYLGMAAEIRRVGVVDEEIAAQAYETGADKIIEEDRLEEFECYARDFGTSEPENITKGTMDIDGLTCPWIEYEQYGGHDQGFTREAIRTLRILIPFEARQQITEVRFEYPIDEEETAEKYAAQVDQMISSMHLAQ